MRVLLREFKRQKWTISFRYRHIFDRYCGLRNPGNHAIAGSYSRERHAFEPAPLRVPLVSISLRIDNPRRIESSSRESPRWALRPETHSLHMSQESYPHVYTPPHGFPSPVDNQGDSKGEDDLDVRA